MAREITYIKTGVQGIDAILKGGLYPSSSVLVSGPPGSGKSILGMQYIFKGAKDLGERGLMISVEETNDSLADYAGSLGWDEWGDLVKKKLITVVTDDYFSTQDLPGSLEGIMEMIQKTDATRLVMDSMNLFKYYFPTEDDRRRYLLKFIRILKKKGITSLLISEVAESTPQVSLAEETYLSDGSMSLFFSRLGSNVERCFWVTKMRRQDFSMKIVPMGIGKGGIEVYADAIPYSLASKEE
jgi:KaiC/GvpD/RAD55 family RecA-like ATPase